MPLVFGSSASPIHCGFRFLYESTELARVGPKCDEKRAKLILLLWVLGSRLRDFFGHMSSCSMYRSWCLELFLIVMIPAQPQFCSGRRNRTQLGLFNSNSLR